MSTSLQCVLRSDVARLYRRISKRLAVETTSLYCSCFITPSHHSCSLAWPDPRRKREGLATPDYRSCSSLLKSTHAISIDFAEMHADHIVSSGSPHNNVLHFSSNMCIMHGSVTYLHDNNLLGCVRHHRNPHLVHCAGGCVNRDRAVCHILTLPFFYIELLGTDLV